MLSVKRRRRSFLSTVLQHPGRSKGTCLDHFTSFYISIFILLGSLSCKHNKRKQVNSQIKYIGTEREGWTIPTLLYVSFYFPPCVRFSLLSSFMHSIHLYFSFLRILQGESFAWVSLQGDVCTTRASRTKTNHVHG